MGLYLFLFIFINKNTLAHSIKLCKIPNHKFKRGLSPEAWDMHSLPELTDGMATEASFCLAVSRRIALNVPLKTLAHSPSSL